MLLFLRSLLWTILLPGMIAGYIPWRFFGFRLHAPQSVMQLICVAVAALGVVILLLCIVEFARRGRGTLSPLDPPRKLVVTGLYRWVRNPMYVGVALVLLGEILMSGSSALATYAAIFFLCANLFILAYEEPHLARTFGASYQDYKRHVRRWIPRLSPWPP